MRKRLGRPRWAKPIEDIPHSAKGLAQTMLMAHYRLFGRDEKYVELTAPTPIEEYIRSLHLKTYKAG